MHRCPAKYSARASAKSPMAVHIDGNWRRFRAGKWWRCTAQPLLTLGTFAFTEGSCRMLRPSMSSAASSNPVIEHAMCARVWAEFREMPGLNLTLAQAARLFSLEREKCGRVLHALVMSGVLTTDGVAFARADSGRRCT